MKNLYQIILCIGLVSCQQNGTTEKELVMPEVDSTMHLASKIDSLSTLIAADTLNATLYFERAELHLKNNSIMPGADDLQKSVELDSTNAKYWEQLGVLHYALKQSRNAKDAWEQCADLDSRSVDCRLNLAEIYLAVDEFKKGQKRLNEILEFDKKNSSALFLTGNYALAQLDTVKAMKYIQASINENQDFFKAYDQMGVLYSAQGDLLALDYYNAALRLRPYRYDIHYKVGMFYQSLGAYDEAILAYDRALEVNPEHSNSVHNKAVIAVFKGDNATAVAEFTKAIGIDASYLEAYFGRAYAYELVGEILKSESDYRTCLMLEPSYKPAMDGLERIGK